MCLQAAAMEERKISTLQTLDRVKNYKMVGKVSEYARDFAETSTIYNYIAPITNKGIDKVTPYVPDVSQFVPSKYVQKVDSLGVTCLQHFEDVTTTSEEALEGVKTYVKTILPSKGEKEETEDGDEQETYLASIKTRVYESGKKRVDWVVTTMAPAKTRVNGVVNTVSTQVTETIAPVADKINVVVSSATEKVNDVVASTSSKFSDTIAPVKTKVNGVVSSATEKVNDVVASTSSKFSDTIAPVKTKVNGVVSSATEKVNDVVASTSSKFSDTIAPVKTKVNGVVSSATEKVNDVIASTSSKFSDTIAPVKTKVNDVVASTSSKISETIAPAKTKATDAFNTAKTRVSETMTTIKAGPSVIVSGAQRRAENTRKNINNFREKLTYENITEYAVASTAATLKSTKNITVAYVPSSYRDRVEAAISSYEESAVRLYKKVPTSEERARAYTAVKNVDRHQVKEFAGVLLTRAVALVPESVVSYTRLAASPVVFVAGKFMRQSVEKVPEVYDAPEASEPAPLKVDDAPEVN